MPRAPREPASSRVTYFILQANIGKNWERFGKNADEWTGRVEKARKNSLAVSIACMAIY